MADHITNTLESAEAPVSKFSQVVKTQDHVMSEFSKQWSDALGVFSEFLTNFAAYKCSDFAQKFQNMNSFVSLSRDSFLELAVFLALGFIDAGQFWSLLLVSRPVGSVTQCSQAALSPCTLMSRRWSSCRPQQKLLKCQEVQIKLRLPTSTSTLFMLSVSSGCLCSVRVDFSLGRRRAVQAT